LRQNLASLIDLTLGNNSEIEVAKYGYTGTEPSFDLRGNFSSITMTGGRIIIANGNNNAGSDLTINAENGGGITGGTIQIGDSINTVSTNIFKISGTIPIYNLHLVGSPSLPAVTTTQVSLNYTVDNQILIDSKQKLNIDGNNLILNGDLINYGELLATPNSITSLPWEIRLRGANDQNFRNYNSSKEFLEMYQLIIDKPSGNFLLGAADSPKSSVKINNLLEFSLNNQSVIDAFTYNQKVIVGPNTNSLGVAKIFRNNLGHIYGTLSRYIESSSINKEFLVGADTLTSYRPVLLNISGLVNTLGYIDVTPHNILHPQIASSKLIPAMTIPRYWTVQPSQMQGFALGIDGKFEIKTVFLNPNDIPAGANLDLFEHNLTVRHIRILVLV